MTHLVLCCDCQHMRPADDMRDEPRGYVCAGCPNDDQETTDP